MLQQHFGFTQLPFDAKAPLFDDGPICQFQERFQWLLDHPGMGLLTGEPGVGKTALMRHVTQTLNPHRYQILYSPETDFGRFDLYRNLALEMGLQPAFRRAQLWRDIKARLLELRLNKNSLPLWIIDEAHNLPHDFFHDLSAFLNFTFDSQSMLTVWLVGQPSLKKMLRLVAYEALASRIQVRYHLNAIFDSIRFKQLIEHAFKHAGCEQTLVSDSGLEMLRQASAGKPQQVKLLLTTTLQLARLKNLNHLSDELIQHAIEELK